MGFWGKKNHRLERRRQGEREREKKKREREREKDKEKERETGSDFLPTPRRMKKSPVTLYVYDLSRG